MQGAHVHLRYEVFQLIHNHDFFFYFSKAENRRANYSYSGAMQNGPALNHRTVVRRNLVLGMEQGTFFPPPSFVSDGLNQEQWMYKDTWDVHEWPDYDDHLYSRHVELILHAFLM